MRWLMEDGHVSTFRNPSNYSNGNTFDFEGRQIACEHATRRVVRYEHSGAVTVLADRYDGKPLNAPNDVVVHPDGGVWFTDPGYGAMWDYEGGKAELELKEAVYRIDPATGAVNKKIDELDKPNGLCFDPGYKRLYVVDTGTPQNIMVWDLADGDRAVTPGHVFADMKMDVDGKTVSGGSDGIRCDTDGNVWSAAGWGGEGYDGVHVFAPDGARIGKVRLPEGCSNVCFGGPKRNRLFMTASQSIYAVYVNTRGAHIT
jgi:gluconolactonase